MSSSFPDLDHEFRDGEVVERSFRDYRHSRAQALLIVYFEALRGELSVYACPEIQLKPREGLYLIPDVVVFRPAPLPERASCTRPLIVIEILSPDDRLAIVRGKLTDYWDWGVKHVWLVDPHSRRMYSCDPGLTEVVSLRVPELGIELTPEAIFE